VLGMVWGIINFLVSLVSLDCNHLYFDWVYPSQLISHPINILYLILFLPMYISSIVSCNIDALNSTVFNVFGFILDILFGLMEGLVVGVITLKVISRWRE